MSIWKMRRWKEKNRGGLPRAQVLLLWALAQPLPQGKVDHSCVTNISSCHKHRTPSEAFFLALSLTLYSSLNSKCNKNICQLIKREIWKIIKINSKVILQDKPCSKGSLSYWIWKHMYTFSYTAGPKRQNYPSLAYQVSCMKGHS